MHWKGPARLFSIAISVALAHALEASTPCLVTTPIGSGNDEAFAIAVQPDGKILVAGSAYNGTDFDFAVARYNPDFTLDTSFDFDGIAVTPVGWTDDRAQAAAIQPDGKIVVAGFATFNERHSAVVRYNPDGSLDLSFDGDGRITPAMSGWDDAFYDVVIQTDGKIVVVGTAMTFLPFTHIVVARFESNGAADPSFAGSGSATLFPGSGFHAGEGVALQLDGKIVVAGTFDTGSDTDFLIARYNSDGTLDGSFSGGGVMMASTGAADQGKGVAIQADGKIVVAGRSQPLGDWDFALVRVNPTGGLDPSFDFDGFAITSIGPGGDFGEDLVIQPDGKIVAAGSYDAGAGSFNMALTRYNSDGTLDTSFDGDGILPIALSAGDDFGYALGLEAGGKILVAGSEFNGTDQDFALVRVNSVGSSACDLVTLHPIGPGTINSFTTISGACAASWDCVNDQPANGPTGPAVVNDGIGSLIRDGGAGNDREMYLLVDGAAPPGSIITALVIFAQLGVGGGSPSIQLSYQRLGYDPGWVDGPAQLLTQTCCNDLVTWSLTGLDWTPSELDALEIGLLHPGGGIVELSQIYVEVTYVMLPPKVRYRSIGTAPDYSTGSVTTVANSHVVSGSMTSWVTANRGRGDRIWLDGNDYTVLSVDSENQLTLTEPYTGTPGSGRPYVLSRQFPTIQKWEDCISFSGACVYFPVASPDLVADNRSEVGVLYKDSVFALPTDVEIDGSTTDASHTITLTAAFRNRHHGVAGAGVVIDGQNSPTGIRVLDDYVTLEWLELVGVRGGAAPQAAIKIVASGGGPTGVVVQNVLVHDFYDPLSMESVAGIRLSGPPPKSVTIRNCMIWDGDEYGIEGDDPGDLVTIENCSIDDIRDVGAEGIDSKLSTFTVRNTIVTGSTSTDFAGAFDPSSSNNISSDSSAPGPGSQFSVSPSAVFVNPGADLHLRPVTNPAVNTGLDLSASFTGDIDDNLRTTPWEVGADDVGFVPSQINYRSIGTAPDYATGTVSAINGSAAVLGNGTSFRAANRGRGDRIRLDGIDYVVLEVISETELTLTAPFSGATGAGKPYVISRQFAALSDWEACIRGGFCPFFPVSSPNLVADDRKEIGIVYDDGVSYGALAIDGAVTDATHDIVLTADAANRHDGVAGSGAVIDLGGASGPGILVRDDHVTIEWMEIRNSGDNGVLISGLGPTNRIVVRNNLVHDLPASGIRLNDPLANVEIYNNIVYNMSRGIFFDQPPVGAEVSNNTVYNCAVAGYAGVGGPFGMVTLRNNLGHTVSADFDFPGGVNASSDYNLSRDFSAPGVNSLTGVLLPAVNFFSTVLGAEDLHIRSPSSAENAGAALGGFDTDIDGAVRSLPWDIGADEAGWPLAFRIHYRSIGINPGALASAGTASATASTATVTFTSPLPTNVGIGDELVLDPGGINEIAHILSRDSSTQATVEAPVANNHSFVSYLIRRAFNTLQNWENARGGDLVLENRREVGLAYNDGTFTSGVSISGSKTDAARYMKLTVARADRHFGVPGAGVRLDGMGTAAGEILIGDNHTQIDWLEVYGVQGVGAAGIRVKASNVSLGQLLVHNNEDGVRTSGSGGHGFTIRNSIVYGNIADGIEGDEVTDNVAVENCTVYGNGGEGLDQTTGTPFTVTNTIAMNNGSADFGIPGGIQSYTISSDGTGVLPGRTATSLTNPGPGDWVVFTDLPGADFHLRVSPENDAVDTGADLSARFSDDIDQQPRPSGTAWDIGADELGGAVGAPILSSLVDQTFVVGSGPAGAATITIADDAVAPTITATDDIRIRIPAGFNMRWDPAATMLSIGGGASFKVDGAVKAFEDFGHTVVLDVLSDFAANDEIVVNGLGFWSFTAPSPAGNLELEVFNDGTVSALDDKSVAVAADVNPNLSSDDNQVFIELQPPAPASPITITEGTTPLINGTNDIRIRIPAGFNMTWDPGFGTIGVTGPGASNVDTFVSYEDLDKTLVIQVTAPFAPGEHIVLTGLQFLGFSGPSPPDRLILDVGVTDLDDKTVSITGAADVRFLTATATDSQVTLEWLTPSVGACDAVVVRGRSDGVFPTSAGDGYPVAVVSPCTLNTKYSASDPMAPLTNGNLYAYAAFVEYGGTYTPGKFVKARPVDTVLTPVRWAYSTGATSMAPPGLRFWSGASFVYTVANDSILHSMNGGNGLLAGKWPANWTPFAFGAPAQARPIPFPFAVGAATNGAVFVGSQDGSVYAIDADDGTEEWKQPIASMVQASPGGHFKAFDATALDIVVVGTRNSGAANTIEALDKDTGNPVWSFDNSPAQLGDGTQIGIISGAASIDYPGKRIYFASRQGTGAFASTDTLWCLDISGGTPELLWAKSLGNIDGSPILYQSVVYVGSNAGVLYAVDAASGNVNWSLPLGDGPIKSYIFPQFGTVNLFVATSNNIWSIADNGLTASINWQVSGADLPAPSPPLFVRGTTKLIVGSGDGHLYQLDVFAPLPVSKVMLGIGAAGVGAPTMDVLKSMIYVGSEEGVVYGVTFPIP